MPFKSFFFKSKKRSGKIQEWLELQSFDEDAIIYLIEKEIYENGMRNLGYIIPRLRDDAYFATLVKTVPQVSEATGFEYMPRQKIFSQNSPANEIKQMPYVQKPFKKEIDTYYDTFKTSSSPVVVAPANATDLSLVDTACYDD